ncbi:sensor histidine kinase [[Empedobacter] haloabium]|uniref:Sensor histidine kinase n=1 Tax=[Empedobacter] haloabium TaxID=592317 RepID=A0ABZ1UQ70_9BURK
MRPTSLLLAATLLLVVRLTLRMSACEATPAEQREADARARLAGRRATDYALENIREEERAYIARELHDDLGQLLATLRVDMSLLLQQPAPNPAIRELMTGMDERLLSAITSLRRIASNLRPRALDEGGLYFALQSLRHDFEQRHGVACKLEARESELVLNDRTSTAIYRIVQESLTNIARHANASHVRIVLRRAHGMLHVTIDDDGRGIAQSDMEKPASFGLLGMRERVWAIRGDIAITGSPRGTRIAIHLPLPE